MLELKVARDLVTRNFNLREVERGARSYQAAEDTHAFLWQSIDQVAEDNRTLSCKQ